MPSMISEMAVVGEHVKFGRVYSTGLQGQVWQKTQVSQGKIFLAFCYHNNSPDRGIIKIKIYDWQQEDWENYLARSVRSCAR